VDGFKDIVVVILELCRVQVYRNIARRYKGMDLLGYFQGIYTVQIIPKSRAVLPRQRVAPHVPMAHRK